jgi:hypothetical protein
MKYLLLSLAFVMAVGALEEERRQSSDDRFLYGADFGLPHDTEKKKTEHVRKEEPERKKESTDEERKKSKENVALLRLKSEQLLFSKMVDFFLNNPNTKHERECFAKFKAGESVDFVIDLAASPSSDKLDKMLAEDSPVALYLQRHLRSASSAYRSAVEYFIEKVTYDIKPELTHSVIVDNRKKFFLRGQAIDEEKSDKEEFKDEKRNLNTLWPVRTKSVPETFLSKIIKNNLGRLTRLALANRDNGVPTVLRDSRRSKPVYTVVITDGASGAKIHDLTDDLSKTTLIDIGNHRFIKNLSWNELQELASFYTVTAPQQLILMADTIRMTACCFATEK